jgi:hypothetical protein
MHGERGGSELNGGCGLLCRPVPIQTRLPPMLLGKSGWTPKQVKSEYVLGEVMLLHRSRLQEIQIRTLPEFGIP